MSLKVHFLTQFKTTNAIIGTFGDATSVPIHGSAAYLVVRQAHNTRHFAHHDVRR